VYLLESFDTIPHGGVDIIAHLIVEIHRFRAILIGITFEKVLVNI
jgi:hypothetical protein